MASGQNYLVGVTEVQSCDSFEVLSKTVGVKKNCAVPNPFNFNFNTGSRCRARSSCALLSLLMEQTLSPSLPFPIPMV